MNDGNIDLMKGGVNLLGRIDTMQKKYLRRKELKSAGGILLLEKVVDEAETESFRSQSMVSKQAIKFDRNIPAIRVKDIRLAMDVAIFRIGKKDKRAGEIMRHELNDGYVEVKAGPDGMASVWDYDIILMLTSLLAESMNLYKQGKAEKPGKIFRSGVGDILKFCRKGDGGNQASTIESALDRLKGTTLKLVRLNRNIDGRPVREVRAEGLISSYSVISYTRSGKVGEVQIEVPEWLFCQICENDMDVLTVNPDYFSIECGVGRFVYRLARRVAGRDLARWTFKKIYERSGSSGEQKKFNYFLRVLIKNNCLPEYELHEERGKTGPILVMERRVCTTV